MKTKLRSEKSYKSLLTAFFILTILSLVGTAVLGELFLPIAAAFFAVLLIFEEKNHILSIISAIFGVIIAFLPFEIPPVFGIFAVLCGGILFLFYSYGAPKCDAAFIITIIISLGIVFSFFLVAFAKTGDYNIDSAIKFYTELYQSVKAALVQGMLGAIESLPEGTSGTEMYKEYIVAAIDGIFNLLISFIVIISFAATGVMLKLFSHILRVFYDEDCKIHNWKFSVPSIYAYLYIALFLVSSFVTGSDVLEISILNLSGIFATVFAYIGLKAVIALFAKKKRKALGVITVILAISFLGNIAIDIISVFGVFHTIQENKLLNK